MSNIVLKAENISKQYRLGQLGTGTISHDLNRMWAKMKGKEDPYLKVGDVNNRSEVGGSDYVWSLKDINFEVEQGEVLGIIGKNGAGKSTLLKILSQVTSPTTGQVKVKGRIAALLEVGTGFHPELTGKENIFLNGAILGMTKVEIKRKLDEIVDFSGVAKYLDTPVKRYSSGMMVRLGFAVAAHLEPEILIVDEVLAVGDAEFQEKCLGKMKDVSGQGRTVLFVSHNMSAVKSLCSRSIILQRGLILDSGNTSTIVQKYLNNNLKNSKKYDQGPLSELEIVSENGTLKLVAKYNVNRPISLPNLGFIINDPYGNPIFGNNPKLLGYSDGTKYSSSGIIEITIKEPKLRNGRYTLSVWFGDGNVDFFEDKDCIGFEISEFNDQYNSENLNIGSVKNICEYFFK